MGSIEENDSITFCSLVDRSEFYFYFEVNTKKEKRIVKVVVNYIYLRGRVLRLVFALDWSL